jgi:hypothetical protein
MSDKLRSVNTKFWDDPFIESINPAEKLLFLYLLTNSLSNLLGVYEITIKRICYDTSLAKDTVLNGLKRFEKDKKAYYIQNYIILPNWIKNQHLNSNMKIAVAKEFNSLPKELKQNILGNGSEGLSNGSEGFATIKECIDKYKVEIESEIEDEKEGEIETVLPFEYFWDLYDKKIGDISKLKTKWDKVSEKERIKILEYIPKYKNSQPDKRYRKDPSTFLNNKSWNDEIIPYKEPAQKDKPPTLTFNPLKHEKYVPR